MAKHFTDELVKLSYWLEKSQRRIDPEPEDLRAWDGTLEERYGELIRDALPNDTRRNQSIIAMLSVMAKGRGKTKVDNAVEYWTHVKGRRL